MAENHAAHGDATLLQLSPTRECANTRFTSVQPLHLPGDGLERVRRRDLESQVTTGFTFNRQSILLNAPDASGVYVLYNGPGLNVYVGESGSIRDRLLQHVTTPHNPCVARANPQWFAYELVQPAFRVARQNQLIAELRPTCNERLG